MITLENATALADRHPMGPQSGSLGNLLHDHDPEARDQVREWMREARREHSGDLLRYFNQTDVEIPSADLMRNSYTGRSHSIPALMAYLRDRNLGPWLPTAPGAVPPVDEQHTVAYWANVPQYDSRFRGIDRAWLATLRPQWDRFCEDTGRTPYSTFDDSILDNPGGCTILIRDWMTWMVNHPAVPQGNSEFVTAAPSLPTSPRDAFPTWEQASEAALAWCDDTSDRLPQELAIDGSYRRGGESMAGYRHEMRSAWDADDFALTTDGGGRPRQTPFAAGFWRDVRDLGYGTPYWTAAAKDRETVTMPAGTSAMPIGPEHPGWDAWWTQLRAHAQRDGYLGQFRTLATAMGYAEPAEYVVTLRVTSTTPLTRQNTTEYLREHPESITQTRDVYAA